MRAWPEAAQTAHAWASKMRSASGKDQVAQFLKIRRFEDLNIDAYEYQQYVARLLKTVIATDLDSAKEVLAKAQSLEATARKRGTWRYFSHESLTTGVIRELTQNTDQPDLNCLGLILHLLRDQDQSHVTVSPSTLRNIGSQLRQGYREDMRASGDNALAGFEKLYGALQRVVGPSDVSGLSGVFSRVLDQVRSQDIDGLIAWLETQASTDPCPNLNAEFQVLLWDRKIRYSGQPRESGQETGRTPDIEGFYLSVLDNNDLSVQWRLLAYLGLRDSGLSTEEPTLAAARLLSRAWSLYPDLATEFASPILFRLLEIKDRSDLWTEVARRLCQSYVVMRQKQANLANFQSATQYTISGNSLTLTTAGGPLVYSASYATIQPVPATSQ